MRISDWSSDVCSSDLLEPHGDDQREHVEQRGHQGGESDLAVGHTQDLGHEEGRGAHDRRQDLAGGGGGGLDGGGERRRVADALHEGDREGRSEEHTSELQSLMRISYAVFCLKKKKKVKIIVLMYT